MGIHRPRRRQDGTTDRGRAPPVRDPDPGPGLPDAVQGGGQKSGWRRSAWSSRDHSRTVRSFRSRRQPPTGRSTGPGASSGGGAASAGPLAGTWRIGYDDDDRIVSITQRGVQERTTTFEYDDLGNLVEQRAPDGILRRYDYSATGIIDTVYEASGLTRHFEWDPQQLVSRITETEPDGRIVRAYEYLHDGLRRLRVFRDVTDPSAPLEIELQYDFFTVTGIWQR